MRALDFVVQPETTPPASLAHDLWALDRVGGARTGGILRVYAFPGDVLSLGRYCAAPQPGAGPARIRLHRRLSGGRPVACGRGFVGVSLTLPHRSALVSDDPLALRPEQVMNRAVRGVMEAGRLAGVSPVYPGRDVLTVDRAPLAVLSFEVASSGAVLFEAMIADQRAFGDPPAFEDGGGSSGVATPLRAWPRSVSLAHALGAPLGIERLAELLRLGYERQFALSCRPCGPLVAGVLEPEADAAWLAGRRPPAGGQYAAIRTQLGTLEAHVVTDGAVIHEFLLSGDFIANSPAIETLEKALHGCAAQRAAVAAVVSRVFAVPENFILGVGAPQTITEAVCRALGC